MRKISIRTLAVMLHDVCVAALAFFLSIAVIKHQLVPNTFQDPANVLMLFGLVIATQFTTFYFFGLYKAMIRFSSIPDLIRISKGVLVAVPLTALVLFITNNISSIHPLSFVIDWALLSLGLSIGRLAYRMMKDSAVLKLRKISKDSQKRTFIIGAGIAGERFLREISLDARLPINVVGLIDDSPQKIGKSIRGVNIYGPIENLPRLLSTYDVQQVIIAIPSASHEQIRKITTICREADNDIYLKIIPSMAEVIEGGSLKSLRNIEPEDLLGRKAHNLDIEQMSSILKDQVVLVTGAGGSIGSELCKQIAKFQPKLLVVFELTELFLYELEYNLKQEVPDLKICSIIGDVRNKQKLNYVFETYRPQVVFHAAAYKHVPLMEQNSIEAVRTNIMGTYNVANVASKYKCDRFVLISSDKAVNPTNVMGTTKRIAELVCLHLQSSSTTKFMIVRFGNVLGSSGSVIPLFKKQIEKGGPITVTHPDMKRFFMSIPEAAQLVIQACALGDSGEVMVLDMGEPMNITDLAIEMIELAGHKPGVDIKIEYTGLRPGEKLYEELFHQNETSLPTKHPMVKIAKTQQPSQTFKEQLEFLMTLPDGAPNYVVKEAIKSMVPEYSYQIENKQLEKSI